MGAALSEERLLAIIETQKEIAATELDIDAVMALVVRRARELTGAAAAVIELADGEEMVYHVGSGAAAEEGGVAESEARSLICVPLSYAGRPVGLIKVYDPGQDAFSDEDLTTLDVLSGVIAAQMAHARDFQRSDHDSRHDMLTDLPNRREFEGWLAAELARLRRHGGLLALCMLDLDRFKQINDHEGHGAGDAVLRAVAGHLDRLRGEDRVFRLGGDEFAVVLAETGAEGAAIAMGRITTAIERDPACSGVGVSWGGAALEPDDDLASLVARADAALCQAKRTLRR